MNLLATLLPLMRWQITQLMKLFSQLSPLLFRKIFKLAISSTHHGNAASAAVSVPVDLQAGSEKLPVGHGSSDVRSAAGSATIAEDCRYLSQN
jgi:hypothetical protein